ncbi:MAG: acyl carrier protein [Clostridia bacterium]|nr:acyl carrier protein [Clostridia bacterium]
MFETVKKILVDELQIDPSTVTLEAELSADLGINSIELANLVMLCEDKFDLTIDDEDIHRFLTVGDVVEFLESR